MVARLVADVQGHEELGMVSNSLGLLVEAPSFLPVWAPPVEGALACLLVDA